MFDAIKHKAALAVPAAGVAALVPTLAFAEGETGITSALTTAFSSGATEATGAISALLPVLVPVLVAVAVAFLGIKFGKRLMKG